MPNAAQPSLLVDLVLTQGKYSDVTLLFPDGQCMAVHKDVLAAHSKFFADVPEWEEGG